MWAVQRMLVERWWNGRYGRLGRKEVRLYRQVAERWVVEVAEGDIDHGRMKATDFDSEQAARDYLAYCQNLVPDTRWTSLSGPTAPQ